MYLCNPYLVPVLHRLTLVLIGSNKTSGLARLILLQHAFINYMELIIEHYIAIYFLNDVVLDEDQAVDLDVDREPIGIEARTDLLVDFNKDIVCWFFD